MRAYRLSICLSSGSISLLLRSEPAGLRARAQPRVQLAPARVVLEENKIALIYVARLEQVLIFEKPPSVPLFLIFLRERESAPVSGREHRAAHLQRHDQVAAGALIGLAPAVRVDDSPKSL